MNYHFVVSSSSQILQSSSSSLSTDTDIQSPTKPKFSVPDKNTDGIENNALELESVSRVDHGLLVKERYDDFTKPVVVADDKVIHFPYYKAFVQFCNSNRIQQRNVWQS